MRPILLTWHQYGNVSLLRLRVASSGLESEVKCVEATAARK
jgi:hypothetical protein